MILKRATKKLQEAGINLQVRRGLWGPYLYDPALMKQTSRVHKSAEDCVRAAIAGERPQAPEEIANGKED